MLKFEFILLFLSIWGFFMPPVSALSSLQPALLSRAASRLQPDFRLTHPQFASLSVDKFSSSQKKAEVKESKFEQITPKVYQFGTSGYRAIGKDFSDSVPILTQAISDYLIRESQKTGEILPVLLGGDTRDFSHDKKEEITLNLLSKGFDVYSDAPNQTPTPVLAYAAKHLDKLGLPHTKSAGAILLTASHNPWAYGGYNFLTNEGEVAPNSVSKQFEALQAKPLNLKLNRKGKLGQLYPTIFRSYLKHLDTLIDFKRIRDAKIAVNYDPMYGAATAFFPDMMAERQISMTSINDGDQRPAHIHANGPDPTAANLADLAKLVREDEHPKNLKVGLANDGDADRFGVLDESGKFIQPNDVLALALEHLAKNKKRNGVVARSQATSHILDEIAKRYGMAVSETPVGYKYVAEVFKEHPVGSAQPVVLGGESSGGLSIYGHVPEKDGMIANLTMMEMMAYEQKPLGVLLKDIKDSLPNKFGFTELAVTTDKKDALAEYFAKLAKTGGKFNGVEIDVETTQKKAAALQEKFHTTDGTKLYLKDGSWILVRKSGTEPMARIYFEVMAPSQSEVTQKRESMMKHVNTLLTSAPFGIASKSIKVKVNE